MRLFFKHLFRSIRRRPLQPLLLILILTLAVATSLFSASLKRALDGETSGAQTARYGAAHITVTLDGGASSRFMFALDAEALLGARAEVAGCMELPIAYGTAGEAVFGIATDFSEIGRIFDLSFSSYGSLTPSTVADAVFLSADFAQKNGLAVADAFTARVFGKEKTYTVAGISPQPFIEDYDVMVDNSGIASILAADSLILSSMKDGFRPCSTLYIEVLGLSGASALTAADEEKISAVAALLAAAPTFEGRTVSVVHGAVANGNYSEGLSWVVTIAIVLACLLSAAVAFSCLYILSVERSEENRSFMLSGARASQLHLLQYAEVALYLLFGSALGIALSLPVFRAFARAFDLRYALRAPAVSDILLTVGLVAAVGFLTVTCFVLSEPMLKRPAREGKGSLALRLCPLLSAALSAAAVYLLPLQLRYLCFVPLALTFTLAVFAYTPPLFLGLIRALDRRLSLRCQRKCGAAHPSLFYAVKNCGEVKMLRNTARLTALLGFVVASALLLVMSSVGHLHFSKNAFSADHAVLGATENCYLGVRDARSVEECYRVYLQTAQTVKGRPLLVLGADGTEAFAEGLRPDTVPKGKRAAISSGDARLAGVRVGDTLALTVGGKMVEVEIAEIMDSTLNAVIIDNEYFGLHYNVIFVNRAAEVDEATMLSEISERTKTELATVMRIQDFWHERLGVLEVYLAAGLAILCVVLFLSLVATLDNLGQSYRMRREALSLYRLSGMSRGALFRMKAYEILLSLAFGLLIALLATAALYPFVRASLHAFGFEQGVGIRNCVRLILS